MNAEQFIEKQLRAKLPEIDQMAIDAAIQYYKRNQSAKKGGKIPSGRNTLTPR
jgi:uncharacterized protein (DUF433 family)